MEGGSILTAILAWLRNVAPYLYDVALILLGKEWQKKIDQADAEHAKRIALEKGMEDTRRANEQARLVDDVVDDSDDAALGRLRNFWDTFTSKQ